MFAAALIAVSAAAAPSGLWWPAALPAAAAAVTAGYAASWRAGRRRLRADLAFRTQELLIGYLWETARRLPAGAVLTDPVTGRALAAERDCGFLTLVAGDPPAGPGVPARIAIVRRYAVGFARWPARPPLMHDIAPAKGHPGRMSWRQARQAARLAEQTGACDTDLGELTELAAQLGRAVVAAR
jgi:hypothetical protein